MADEKYLEQKKTLEDARRILKKYKKCAVIRPTGFGKTYLLTELIRDYKSVLYLYPSAVIRDTVVDRYYGLDDEESCGDADLNPETIEAYKAIGKIPNCTLMTYAKLIRLDHADIKAMKYDLVICDEMHRMGGQMTKAACEKLFAALVGKAAFIGATATPTRSDNFDAVSHFFSDRMCYIFTMHDAIQAGIICKPYYCYATYDIKKDLENTAKESGQDLKDKLVASTISMKAIEIAKLYNVPTILKDVCDHHATDTVYMKFIAFFASKAHMDEKLPEVENWFREAYPQHSISTLRISSKDKAEASNVSKLEDLTNKEMAIDLIACIDMLNMGYHVDNLTGIIMYRGTKSGIIFAQQMGRALSAGAGASAIILDIVDNLHRKAIYDLYTKKAPGTRNKKNKNAVKDNYVYDKETGKVMFRDPNGDLIETQYHVTANGTVVDAMGHATTFKLEDGEIVNKADPASKAKDINRVTPDCLIATGHEATYREILAKAMVEPLSHRCKFAMQLHFRSWCQSHNIDHVPMEKKLADLSDLNIQDFYQEFGKLIKAKKLAYPLQDAKSLLAVGADGSMDAPLAICCKATNVSVDTLLDMLFAQSPPRKELV